MNRFCFHFGNDGQYLKRMTRVADEIFFNPKLIAAENFAFIYEDTDNEFFVQNGDCFGIVAGYVRNDGSQSSVHPHNEIISAIHDRSIWPLNNNFTGYFSILSLNKRLGQIVLCNDVIGCMPLDYFNGSGNFVCSNSHLMLGRTIETNVDMAGFLQTLIPSHLCYGQRTMLENVNRLLPGQYMQFDKNLRKIYEAQDCSLYDEVIEGDIRQLAEENLQILDQEIAHIVRSHDPVYIAMSGGVDSRLMGARLRHVYDKKVYSYSYGSPEKYELKLAKRVSAQLDMEFKAFPLNYQYFPNREELRDLVRANEARPNLLWKSIIDSFKAKPHERRIMLIGDLYETTAGSHIGMGSFSSDRIKSLLYKATGREKSWTPSSPAAFSIWKDQKVAATLRKVSIYESNLSDTASPSRIETLAKGC